MTNFHPKDLNVCLFQLVSYCFTLEFGFSTYAVMDDFLDLTFKTFRFILVLILKRLFISSTIISSAYTVYVLNEDAFLPSVGKEQRESILFAGRMVAFSVDRIAKENISIYTINIFF